MKDKMACPKCGCEEYHTCDYTDGFDGEFGEQQWQFYCPECGCEYTVTKVYQLINTISEVSVG